MKLYPKLVYFCPVTGDIFTSKKYCEETDASRRINNPLPCPYYKGTEKVSWGEHIKFDVILCDTKFRDS